MKEQEKQSGQEIELLLMLVSRQIQPEDVKHFLSNPWRTLSSSSSLRLESSSWAANCDFVWLALSKWTLYSWTSLISSEFSVESRTLWAVTSLTCRESSSILMWDSDTWCSNFSTVFWIVSLSFVTASTWESKSKTSAWNFCFSLSDL